MIHNNLIFYINGLVALFAKLTNQYTFTSMLAFS